MKNSIQTLGLVSAIALTSCSGSQPSPQPSGPKTDTTCHGIPDVTQFDPDCAAINEATQKDVLPLELDGKFHPERTVIRATTAKAVLETFGKFHNGIVYCEGKDPFPDVKAGTKEGEVVCAGVKEGMLTGYKGPPAPGHFGPDDMTNRAQLVTMVCRLIGENCTSKNDYSVYKDVKPAVWFTAGANLNAERALLSDPLMREEGKFRPDASITKRELAETLYRLETLGLTKSTEIH